MPQACPAEFHVGALELPSPKGIVHAQWKPQWEVAVVLEPYSPDELIPAYALRCYIQLQTHRRQPIPELNELDKASLQDSLTDFDLNLLDMATTDTHCRYQVSLQPNDSVAGAVSKSKGRLSKLLAHDAGDRDRTLARGYFACSTGDTTSRTLDRYLSAQAAHHHYDGEQNSPAWTKLFPISDKDELRLNGDHCVVRLRLHLVFGTMFRKGVFTSQEAETVTQMWKMLEQSERYFLLKASFVPDHVHLAVQVSATTKPIELAASLMNSAQETMNEHFEGVLIRFAGPRLWQTGLYIGTFGNVTTSKMRLLLKRWSERATGA